VPIYNYEVRIKEPNVICNILNKIYNEEKQDAVTCSYRRTEEADKQVKKNAKSS